MKLHTLNRALAMPQAHQQAARCARAHLQALGERVFGDKQAVIAADLERGGEPFEEASAVVLDQLLVPMNWLRLDELCAEVLGDRLMPQADPKDGEIVGGRSQALHRRARASRPPGTRTNHEARRLTRADRGPIRAVRAQDFYLSPELLEELHEVEGEGVAVIEDQNHRTQDALTALRCKVKHKKRGWRDSCLAEAQSWNKVPG